MLDRSVSAEPSAASSDDPNHPSLWIFQNERIIGNGSFGVVYQAIVKQNQKARCRDWQHGTLMLRTLAYPDTPGALRTHIAGYPQSTLLAAWQEVAIKKVLQDKRFKVRLDPCAPAKGMAGYGECGRHKYFASLDLCGCG